MTSNKARAKYGLPPRLNPDGSPQRYDVLRTQKLAAPVTVYVEQFSAHPLEADAAELYGPPTATLIIRRLPHAAHRHGRPPGVRNRADRRKTATIPCPTWRARPTAARGRKNAPTPRRPPKAPASPSSPTASRSFAEIDQMAIGDDGVGNLISSLAEVDFHRVVPPAGYTAEGRTTRRRFLRLQALSSGERPAEGQPGAILNRISAILASGDYDGAIWTQGSPRIEETLYWFNLLLDTTLPICGNAAQRVHGMISNDGPKNIVDSVEYIASRVWADGEGRNHAGMVLIAEQRVYAARDVIKADARPGGFILAGGHGGILASVGHGGKPRLLYVPASLHTWQSAVNLSRLPDAVTGLHGARGAIKDADGRLLEAAIPKVSILKDGSYYEDEPLAGPEQQVDILAWLDYSLKHAPLAGFAVEGLSPYGKPASPSRTRALLLAVYSGLPVVFCGRGNTEGFAVPMPPVHRGIQPDRHQGADPADGVPDEVRDFAAPPRSGASDAGGSGRGQCPDCRLPGDLRHPLISEIQSAPGLPVPALGHGSCQRNGISGARSARPESPAG